MKILVINCGSSSLKYRLFDMTTSTALASGLIERIGESVQAVRKRLGARLWEERPADVDVVVPVPDSGVCAALGFAAETVGDIGQTK